jgi:cobalt-zinc-cadmium efflux system outer membrane protein
LARANAKRDLTTTFNFSHVSGISSGSFFFNIEIPIFSRNQGEILRTRYAITQSQETATAAEQAVLTDVANAYEPARTNGQIVEFYSSGYLKESQESRDISEFAYRNGAASLLDFLDAERNWRATQLGYRQALANYMLAFEQLRQAVGTRSLL